MKKNYYLTPGRYLKKSLNNYMRVKNYFSYIISSLFGLDGLLLIGSYGVIACAILSWLCCTISDRKSITFIFSLSGAILTGGSVFILLVIIPAGLWILDCFDSKKKKESCSFYEESYSSMQNDPTVKKENSYDFCSDKELSFLLNTFDEKTDSKRGQELYHLLTLLRLNNIPLPKSFQDRDLNILQESLKIFMNTPKDVSKEIRKDMEENIRKSIDSIYGEAKEILDRYYERK